MSEQVTQAMKAVMARNKDAHGNRPDYGILATMAPNTSCVEMVLTFNRNARYCCIEPGCHIGASGTKFWQTLRNCFVEAGLEAPDSPMTLKIIGVVEEGVILDYWPRTASAQQYEEIYGEDKARPGH